MVFFIKNSSDYIRFKIQTLNSFVKCLKIHKPNLKSEGIITKSFFRHSWLASGFDGCIYVYVNLNLF